MDLATFFEKPPSCHHMGREVENAPHQARHGLWCGHFNSELLQRIGTRRHGNTLERHKSVGD